MNTPKVILISGCSSGIGRETALLLSSKGFIVYAGVRKRKDKLNLEKKRLRHNLHSVLLNVDSAFSVARVAKMIINKERKIDILINNAGYGLIGPLEEIPLRLAKKEFETNFFGSVRLIKAFLPFMVSRRSGQIITISSIAGFIGRRYASMYSASKFALEGLSESLKEELSPFNISVKLVVPGLVETNFKKNIERPAQKKHHYSMVYPKRFHSSIKPIKVARAILQAIKSEKFRYLVSGGSREKIRRKLVDFEYASYLRQFKD